MTFRLVAVVLSVLLFCGNLLAADFGVCNEGTTKMDYAKLHASGVRWVRFSVNWANIESTPGVYDWSDLDQQVAAMNAAGMNVYLDLMWAPPHATGGFPAYEQYTLGCTEWDDVSTVFITVGDGPQPDNGGKTRKGLARPDHYVVPRGGAVSIPAALGVLANDDVGNRTVFTNEKARHGTFTLNPDGSLTYIHDGSDATEDSFKYWVKDLPTSGAGGIHFEWEEHDYCRNAPHVDSTKLKLFAEALASRYGDSVNYFGIWNEPEYGIYWTPRQWSLQDPSNPDASLRPDLNRYINEVVLPYRDGIKSVRPDALIVGPETNDPDVLNYLLQWEKDTGRTLFDVISAHAYPWGGPYPEAALYHFNGWIIPILQQFNDVRPTWITETDPDPVGDLHSNQSGNLVLAMVQAVRLDSTPSVVFIGSSATWFQEDNVTPSLFYYRFQSLINPGRRRASTPPSLPDHGPRVKPVP